MAQGFTRGTPIDTDPNLSLDSDLVVPSQKAIKDYVDTGLSNKQDALVSGTNIKTVNSNSLLGSGNVSVGTVTSVSATVPSPASPALSVAVSNPTTTPAIAITANGTTAQYFRGDGSLATFPTSIPIIYKSVVDGTSITGIATEQISASQLIPANTFTVGDIIKLSWRIRKTGTASTPTTKLYINTSSSLSGAVQMGLLQVAANTLTIQHQRTLAIKSATNTEAFSNVNVPSDFSWTTVAVTSGNINWTVDQYFIFMCQISTASADTIRTSFYLIEKI